jgi:hypothetical protein
MTEPHEEMFWSTELAPPDLEVAPALAPTARPAGPRFAVPNYDPPRLSPIKSPSSSSSPSQSPSTSPTYSRYAARHSPTNTQNVVKTRKGSPKASTEKRRHDSKIGRRHIPTKADNHLAKLSALSPLISNSFQVDSDSELGKPGTPIHFEPTSTMAETNLKSETITIEPIRSQATSTSS